MLHDLQVWLVTTIIAHSPVADDDATAWAWPIAESVHFLGLCLLIGGVGTFDLRLLGVARRVPIAAMHRLIPWASSASSINISSGLAVPADRAGSVHLQPVVSLQAALPHDRRPRMPACSISRRYRQVFGRRRPSMRRASQGDRRDLARARGSPSSSCGRMLTFYRPAPVPPQESGPSAAVLRRDRPR